MSKNYSSNTQISKHTFKRKQISKPLPIDSKLTKLLDEFIKNSLKLFKYTDLPNTLSESTSIYCKHLINNNPVIPDLVIYNTTFNKNDCFVEGIHCSEMNSFPRVKFEVSVKPLEQPIDNNVQDKGKGNEYFDEEEVEWEDVDAKDLQNVQVTFQKIPKPGEPKQDVFKLHTEEVSKIININSLFGVNFPMEQHNKNDLFSFAEEGATDLFKEKPVDSTVKKPLSSNEIISMQNNVKQSMMPNMTKENLKSSNTIFKQDVIHNKKGIENDSLFSDLSLINRNIPNEINDNKQFSQKIPFLNEGYQDFLNPPTQQEPIYRQQRMPNNNFENNAFMNNPYPNNNYVNFNQVNTPFTNINNISYNGFNKSNLNQQVNYSCPDNFLEDPLYLVKNNINVKGWQVKENDRIIASMNSYELLMFLENRLKNEKLGINNIWVFDSMTDIYYTPMTLYEVLKENVNILLPPSQNRFLPIQNQIPFNQANMMPRNINGNHFNHEDLINNGN